MVLCCLPVGGLVLRFHWSVYQAQLGPVLKLYRALLNLLWARLLRQILSTQDDWSLAAVYMPEDCTLFLFFCVLACVFASLTYTLKSLNLVNSQLKTDETGFDLKWQVRQSHLVLCLPVPPSCFSFYTVWFISTQFPLPPPDPLCPYLS